MDRAGDTDGTNDSDYAESALIEHLRAVNDTSQRPPTITNLEQHNNDYHPAMTPHPQTYISRLESWITTLETAFPDPELCRELWRVTNYLDRQPYQNDLGEHG